MAILIPIRKEGETVGAKKIKYCEKNLKKLGAKPAYKAMKKLYPEMKQKKRECLGRCGLCSKKCFAMIGKKEVVSAPTAESLYLALLERIG
jgi:uncharacterized protein YuzB (UPF0349 family)